VETGELIEVELARRGISGYKLERYHDPDWGCVYAVATGLNAREVSGPRLRLARLAPCTECGAARGC
jgi:hypothetical protein